ncbi:MAG: radical SAM protein, partial [Calditrichaeota bacterium]
MNILLVSTYELGRQPFGLSSPAAWLLDAGFQVTTVDCAVSPFPEADLSRYDVVAFYLPMHTATRLAAPLINRVASENPHIRIICYGLYAPLNDSFLRQCGAHYIIGGEFEEELLRIIKRFEESREENVPSPFLEPPIISHARLKFRLPYRKGLPGLSHYARLYGLDEVPRLVGYVETTRGCKHHCRHCPIVPVYQGKFRLIQPEVVLADVAQQVEMGARHITFGDPDFLNGPGHVIPLIQKMHQQFPDLTFDVTIKIEHLLKHAHLLPELERNGCLIVTTAVESLDNKILARLKKGHSREDFLEVVRLFRRFQMVLNPTFIPFNPWTSLTDYKDLLATLWKLGLAEQVSPIQLAIRLLITNESPLLELPEIQEVITNYHQEKLCYEWEHPQPEMDELQKSVLSMV